MRTTPVVVLILVVLLAWSAYAHETWLLPSAFTPRSNQEVRFDLTSGMSFPTLESPIREDRVAKAAYRLGGSQVDLRPSSAGEKSLVLSQAFPMRGIATVWVELKPKDIELLDEQVVEYFDEIGATEAMRKAWSSQRGHAPWSETYTKHAKTFIAVGEVGEDRSWQTAIGMPLEIVPLTDPLSIEVGSELAIKLLSGGRPMAAMSVGMMNQGSSKRVFRTTDPEGLARFPISFAGAAMIFAVDLRRAPDGRRWVSDFTTMTFHVRP